LDLLWWGGRDKVWNSVLWCLFVCLFFFFCFCFFLKLVWDGQKWEPCSCSIFS
jgi:hypothetical protein